MQASSWIDDLKEWSETEHCCKYFISNASFCTHTVSDGCLSCEFGKMGMSRYDYNRKFLPHFLNDNPDDICAKSGHPAFSNVST